MEKEASIKVPEEYLKLGESGMVMKKKKLKLKNFLAFLVLAVLVLHSMVSIWCLKSEVNELQNKIRILELKAEAEAEMLESEKRNLLELFSKRYDGLSSDEYDDLQDMFEDDEHPLMDNEDENDEQPLMDNEEDPLDEEEEDKDENFGFKRKREIRDFNESSIERRVKNETEEKWWKEKSSTESSSVEYSSKEKLLPTGSHRLFGSTTRKPHLHRKHRKSRIGSAERFFTETHSTTSTPIQVRQSRTKLTQMHGLDKSLWLQNQKFQQHTSPHKDTITKEEALLKGYGKHSEESSYESDRSPDVLSYNMITIHFSADTSHYSRDRDPHYFGNGRMQIKSEVYKDWKPAHWTQGVGMSKYFHLHQGRVTVSTTGIYLIYAQIQYSNVQEVNGFSVFRNKEVVVQCITTSTHPDKHEIKSNTCGISTTILLQSNDSVCIKDLHHGRYVVLTPEKSYFGLVLLSPFKN